MPIETTIIFNTNQFFFAGTQTSYGEHSTVVSGVRYFGDDLVYDEAGIPVSGTITKIAIGSYVDGEWSADGRFVDISVNIEDISTDGGPWYMDPYAWIADFGDYRYVSFDDDDIFNAPSNSVEDTHTIETRDGDDIITTYDSTDRIFGGSGDDLITTTFGDDRIYGGGGDDTIFANFGNNLIIGGAGNDDINVTSDFGIFYVDEVSAAANVSENFVSANNGDDTINVYGGKNEIYGGNGDDDIFVFSDNRSTINGDDGDDVIVTSGAGRSFVYGGDGDDSLTATGGPSVLIGGAGDDTIINGSDGYGQTNDDVLSGNNGDDYILATVGGNDVIFGGNGDDMISVNGGYDDFEVFYVVDEIETESFTRIRGNGGDDIITIGLESFFEDESFFPVNDLGNFNVRGGTGDDLIIDLSSGDNKFVGNAGDDIIISNLGDDKMRGGAGDDQLSAGAGDNKLFGGEGDDILFSNNGGNDRMTGGQGDDMFVFFAQGFNERKAIVRDFTVGEDTLAFASDFFVDEVNWLAEFENSAFQRGDDTVFEYEGFTLVLRDTNVQDAYSSIVEIDAIDPGLFPV